MNIHPIDKRIFRHGDNWNRYLPLAGGRKTNILGIVAWAALAIVFAPTLVCADLVTVLNPSFEEPVVPPSGFTSGVITDWTLSGVEGGVFHPTAADFPATGGAPDGLQTAYSRGATISQVLSDVLSEGNYTLQVDVGNRTSQPFPGYTIQLLAGGVLLAEDDNSLLPPIGDFLTSTVLYTALASDPQLGTSLEIRLFSVGQQTNFDDVRLDFSVIPEPSSVVLAGLGLLAFGYIGFRHRKSMASVRRSNAAA